MAKLQTKLPEIRGEAFTKARESLGLSAKDLSGMACLSIRQIEQIENGESSSFYGPQVKVTAAKKVAGLLKLNEADAFDFSEVVPVKKSVSESAPEQLKSADVDPVKIKAPTNKVKAPTQIIGKAAETNSKKKLFILLSIAAALVFSVVNLRPLFFPEVVKEEIAVVQEAPTSSASESAVDAKPATPAIPEPAVTAAPVVVAATPVVSTECPAIDSAAVSYKTDAPKKSGDMVYLQSKTAQTVCVIDASGKTQNKTLEPGVGVSIYGKPPLKVLTSGQTQVDMYYQGVKVSLSNITAKTIVLEPTEIAQPVAPTDSQFR